MMMRTRIVCRRDGGAEAAWNVTWKVAASESRFHQSADVVVEAVDAATDEAALRLATAPAEEALHICSRRDGDEDGRDTDAERAMGRKSFDFLRDVLRRTTTTSGPQAVKLIGPRGRGNVVRSDIVPRRMHQIEHFCPDVAATVALAEPLQLFSPAVTWDHAITDLATVFRTAVGAIRLAAPLPLPPHDAATWAALNQQVEQRLSLPLVVAHLGGRRVVFLVEGGLTLPFDGACSRQLYESAQSLGIDVVVLAAAGHVLQTRHAEFGHWYHQFRPIDCAAADDRDRFAAEIVAAVRRYEAESGRTADGIVTTYESYHGAVATAASQLGLSCEPVSAYTVATDKFQTSLAEGRRSFTASSVDEAVHIATTEQLHWPLILKPCRGWASELVFKVDDVAQLRDAAPRMKSDSHGAQFVMERYCSGPEVDINFVMYDGKVLFWEIGDETPKHADHGSSSFGELDYLFPSQLPRAEQQTVYDAVLRSITRLGFRNGIYHCEARIENSSVEWRFNSSGIPTLEPRAAPGNAKPAESWLIEINTRPPGGDTCDFIEATWGVDYWALLFVTKLRGATTWADALAQPYRDGAQYHADKVWILASFDKPQKGIWESGNITEELAQRRPDIARHLSQHRTFAKKGDHLRHPSTGANSFVAYLHIFSRHSRGHLLELATEIRRELEIEIS